MTPFQKYMTRLREELPPLQRIAREKSDEIAEELWAAQKLCQHEFKSSDGLFRYSHCLKCNYTKL